MMLAPFARRLHHVGIVVPDWDAAESYLALFGHREAFRGEVPEFDCWCLFAEAEPGATTVELVIPTGGSLARFNKGAGGLHHYAFEVADLDGLTADFARRDLPMLRPEAIKGAGDFRCNFLSPVATRGVLVEFVEPF